MKYLFIFVLFAAVGCASKSDRTPSSVKAQNEESSNRALQHQMPNAPVSTPMAY